MFFPRSVQVGLFMSGIGGVVSIALIFLAGEQIKKIKSMFRTVSGPTRIIRISRDFRPCFCRRWKSAARPNERIGSTLTNILPEYDAPCHQMLQEPMIAISVKIKRRNKRRRLLFQKINPTSARKTIGVKEPNHCGEKKARPRSAVATM